MSTKKRKNKERRRIRRIRSVETHLFIEKMKLAKRQAVEIAEMNESFDNPDEFWLATRGI